MPQSHLDWHAEGLCFQSLSSFRLCPYWPRYFFPLRSSSLGWPLRRLSRVSGGLSTMASNSSMVCVFFYDFAEPSEPNKALEPTTRSVTPRAFLRRFESTSRPDQSNAARVAPERVVAHL